MDRHAKSSCPFDDLQLNQKFNKSKSLNQNQTHATLIQINKHRA